MTTERDSDCFPTVLCVDDEPAVLRALQRVLQRYGCRVLLADSGPAALELLQSEQVEVLISDEAMPGMSGTQLLHQAKAVAPGTSRILLTGHCSEPGVVIRAVNGSEIFRLLAKPWENDLVRQAVAESLGAEPQAWSRVRRRAAERLDAYGIAAGAAAPCE